MVEPAQRRWGRVAALLLLGLILAALGTAWLVRKPIAANVIDRELARRGVPAAYRVKRIGWRTQRLEGVRLGDPRAPDLTAAWVEIDLSPTFGAPEVRAVRAGGVRLRGRVENGRPRFGSVDRLLPAPSGKPFRLPDLAVALDDARLALATPAGLVGLRLDGRGNLAKSFAGRYVATAPRLAVAGCALTGLSMSGTIRTADARPRLAGPFRTVDALCSQGQASDLAGRIDVRLAPALDAWRGEVALRTGPAHAAGWQASALSARATFAGTNARTEGTARLAALAPSGPQGRAARADLSGRYALGGLARFEGRLTADRLALAAVPDLGGFARGTRGTPLAPFAAALARAADRIGRDGQFEAQVRLADAAVAVPMLRLGHADAVLSFGGGQGVRVVGGRVQVNGRLALSGAAVPQVEAELRQAAPGAPLTGLARVKPFVQDGTAVVLAPVRFTGDRFLTAIETSGPLFGGTVERARLPLDGRFGKGGFQLNPGCAPFAFDRLTVSGLRLDPATLRLCPDGPALVANGRVAGRIEAPRLAGTIGGSPVTLDAARARFAGSAFAIDDLAARLGPTMLDIGRLTGAAGQGLSGRFASARGRIGTVPLLVSDAAGPWRFRAGTLVASATATVSDTAPAPRFFPLSTEDLALTIRGQELRAEATLAEPESGTKVVAVVLAHDLGRSTGQADLRVEALRFTTDGLQPETLTRLSLGVIANVEATVNGTGRIAWSGADVTSTGRFAVDAPALAAPFGPVTGVRTELVFTDLLGLVTAPDQRLSVATINPGIQVGDGDVRYRLVPGMRIALDSARWPLAGGTLTLRPATLDFAADAARALTFDIAGLDAARFINQLELANVNATGIFDGTLPMVFDKDGGRIVGGRLAARGPGTLSYVGEVSNANLGIWGGIAFDALKSMAYRDLTIALDGRIDGEMVSEIRFAGVSRGTIQPVATGLIAQLGGRLASRLQQLPFQFNIRVSAPFRGLMATSRSLSDPSLLIQDRLGPGYQTSIHPPESENER